MGQRQPSLTAKNALIVHFAMVMSITAVAAVCWVIRDVVVLDVGRSVVRVLRWIAVTELVAAGFAVARLRSTTELMSPADDVAGWWVVNGGRVLTTWVLAYGVGVTGVVLWLITDDVVILAAVVVSSVLLLMRLAPTRWRAEQPDHTSRLVP